MCVRSILKRFLTMATNEQQLRTVQRIGTHSGVFHCDEVLGCFMLKQLPQYQDAKIIRTRDPEVLKTCDIVIDVGGEYNPETHRYDHHQKSFQHTLSTVRPDLITNRTIRLSSAGLVYAHFGLDIIKSILTKNENTCTQEDLECIYRAVYDGFVEELDAIDNGVPMFAEGTPRYRIDTHLSARVHSINPEWNDTRDVNKDDLFQQAMKLVGEEFTNKVIRIGTVWYPARKLVRKAIDNRKNVHESGQIVELTDRCPWKQHLLELEKEMKIEGEMKFVIYHEINDDSWRIQGIPLQPESFICRVFLHKDWQGISNEELSRVSGIPDCVFCHATGFIGGNKTRAGAFEMALKSLQAHESK